MHPNANCRCLSKSLAFLDGAHTYEDVLFEFSQIRHRQSVGDVLVFDDYE